MYYLHKGFVGLKSKRVKLEEYFEGVEKQKGRKVKKMQEFAEAYEKDFGSLEPDDV